MNPTVISWRNYSISSQGNMTESNVNSRVGNFQFSPYKIQRVLDFYELINEHRIYALLTESLRQTQQMLTGRMIPIINLYRVRKKLFGRRTIIVPVMRQIGF